LRTGLDAVTIEKNNNSIAEKFRERDLILQVKRFLKFAPKGTSKEVLVKDAQEFEQRLRSFENGSVNPELGKLRRQLQQIYAQ
jgi:hypothetical protein